jgi:hypothetical protein
VNFWQSLSFKPTQSAFFLGSLITSTALLSSSTSLAGTLAPNSSHSLVKKQMISSEGIDQSLPFSTSNPAEIGETLELSEAPIKTLDTAKSLTSSPPKRENPQWRETQIGQSPTVFSHNLGAENLTSQTISQLTTFPDIQGHWAEPFIETLTRREIIQGFPDGTFRPDVPVTRAEFAALLRQAFAQNTIRPGVNFVDVPASYWAFDAIQEAYQMGFLQGYPNNVFQPEQNIPRVQALVALSSGLNLTSQANSNDLLNGYFTDAGSIPDYALNSIAAATENRLVVNYPNVSLLNPNQSATRADVAAFIYQALVSAGQLSPLEASNVATQYIVGYEAPVAQTPTPPQQDVETLRAQYLLEVPETIEVPSLGAAASPGSSSGSPTAFGASWGRVFTGIGFQERTRYTDEADGSFSVGFGLGDAQKTVGVEVTASVLSLLGDDAFERGGISFKIHRILPNDFAIAAGVENFITWGESDAGSSGYGVVSKVFRLQENSKEPFSQITFSVGLGGGRFRSEDDIQEGDDSINVFGSMGIRVAEPVSFIADWTGQDLTLGLSIAPFRDIPLVITPAVADITDNAGDGARFILGIGYNYPFR